jgi:prepilin-type N-terminal cleavage/methylation domain-containing protein
MKEMRTKRGFSLLELMISMALGLIVLGSAVQLFKTAMDSTRIVVQRSEMQQNMRAAIELISKDASLAGSGLPPGGIQLPTGGGSQPSRFGCDQTGACHVVNNQYPNNNYMYGVIPGFGNGVEAGAAIPSAPAARNDSITVVYADYAYPLNQYNVTFPGANPTGQIVNIAPNPGFNPAPPLVTAAGGLQVGDLIWLSNTAGNAVGEVTGFTNTTISFADNDALRINQSAAATNNIKALSGGGTMTAYRIFAVTYYLTVPANGQLPRLMRQINGLTPVPVADNIINMQFAYDLYNSTTNNLDPSQSNPIGVGDDLNLTQKINIVVMGQSLVNSGRNAQNMALATSVSSQNMTFRNRYQ